MSEKKVVAFYDDSQLFSLNSEKQPVRSFKMSLVHLLERAHYQGPPPRVVAALLEGNREFALSDLASVTAGDLRAAAEAIRRLNGHEGIINETARSFYLSELGRFSSEPDRYTIDQFLMSKLQLSGAALGIYQTLSSEARDGLYVLIQGGKIYPEQLCGFLANRTIGKIAGGHDRILRTTLLLYNQRVEGYERAFIPGRVDKKYLSDNPARIRALSAGQDLALWFSCHTQATRIRMDVTFDLDWGEGDEALTRVERGILHKLVLPYMSPEGRESYNFQKYYLSKITVESEGKERLVELKTWSGNVFLPTHSVSSKIFHQLIRMALAARQNGIHGGIEYVIEALDIHPVFERRFLSGLAGSRLPFLIRLNGERPRELGRMNLEYRQSPVSKLRVRTRMLPSL